MNKRRILAALGLVCGIVILADFFVTAPLLDDLGHILIEGAIIIGGMAILAGVTNLLFRNGQRLALKETRPGALLSVVGVVAAFGVGVAGLGTSQAWMYKYILLPLQSTFAAVLMFYIMEAVFLHFRTRTAEAALTMGTCLVLLLLQLPVTAAISPVFASLHHWLYAIPITFGIRGILIGTSIGVAISSIRLLAGKNGTTETEE